MKLIIKDQIPPKYVNTFVLRLEFMSGDADAYETKEFDLPYDEAVRCIIFLTALMAARESGGRDSPRTLGDKSVWKTLPNADVVDTFYPWGKAPAQYRALLEWGSDATCEGELASLDDFTVVWFDNFGNECSVEIEA